MLFDLKYAFRQFIKSPGFTAVAVIILALGIGANAAVFTVIDTLLLRGLPVQHPEELVVATIPRQTLGASYPLYKAARRGAKSFSGFVGISSFMRSMVATGSGRTDIVSANTSMVSGDFFSFLGVRPALGRILTPADDKPGSAHTVALLSDAFWRREFGADPGVIGKTILIDSVPFSIVGVAPAGFLGIEVGTPTDIWAPLEADLIVEPSDIVRFSEPRAFNHFWIHLLGRVRPGIAPATAKAELGVIYKAELQREGAPEQFLRTSPFARPNLSPAGSGFVPNRETVASLLQVLLLVVGMVLVIACANVAGLILARSSARQREFAIRSALGAARRHLIRQLLVESMMIALAAGALGLLFAHWGTSWLAEYLPAGEIVNPAIDGRVLAFAALVSIGTGVLVGLLPVTRLSQLAIISAIKDNASSLAGGSGNKLSHVLVALQIAISICLLAGSGLFIRTLQNLRNVDLGFDPSNLAMTTLQFDATYSSARRITLTREVWLALQQMPGVTGATFSVQGGGLVTAGGLVTVARAYDAACFPEGYLLTPNQPAPQAHCAFVGPGYLTTLGIPLYRGRDIDAADVFPAGSGSTASDSKTPATGPNAPASASGSANTGSTANSSPGATPGVFSSDAIIVDEAFVKKFYPNENPLGHLVQTLGLTCRIVGVAKDTRQWDLRESHPFEIYLPATAWCRIIWPSPLFGMWAQLRTSANPATFGSDVRKTVDSVDPRLRTLDYGTMNDRISQSMFQERMMAQTAGCFSLFALFLASLGLYGVLAYAVTRRTREIGVRMALGASAADVILLILRGGMAVAAAGCVVGAIAAAALSHLIASRLYGVPPLDPVTFLATIVVLLLVALLACWIPARRATKVDPLVALRAE